MALTLIQEDGTGKADANSYASRAEAEAYHAGHLYATAWTGATSGQQDAALVMATRVIDAEVQFRGVRAHAGQALQWPRTGCADPDGPGDLPSDAVPRDVRAATCELARELLLADRTASPPGEGLKYLNLGSTQTGYDKTDRRPMLSALTQALLRKFGQLVRARSGAVPLVRT